MSVEFFQKCEVRACRMRELWRYITIDPQGNVKKGPIQTQRDVFNMFPEIAPNFFTNFAVKEMSIRQDNGTQLILIKVNG